MIHELKCPCCGIEFVEDEDYLSNNCPNKECNNIYYWDHCYDEENNEVFFEGYYWSKYK